MRFADELRGVREGLGLSQNRLALEVGVNHSYVSRLEAGKRPGSLAFLALLVTRLGLDDGRRDRLGLALIDDAMRAVGDVE